MEGSCSTGQSPQWAVVPVEGEEEDISFCKFHKIVTYRDVARFLKLC
jgi:hypothetical protein